MTLMEEKISRSISRESDVILQEVARGMVLGIPCEKETCAVIMAGTSQSGIIPPPFLATREAAWLAVRSGKLRVIPQEREGPLLGCRELGLDPTFAEWYGWKF